METQHHDSQDGGRPDKLTFPFSLIEDITRFGYELGTQITGEGGYGQFQSDWNKATTTWYYTLENTAPVLTAHLTTAHNTGAIVLGPGPLEHQLDERRSRPSRSAPQQSTTGNHAIGGSTRIGVNGYQAAVFKLDEIVEVIWPAGVLCDDSIGPGPTKDMAAKSTAHWTPLLDNLFEHMEKLLTKTTKAQFDKHFTRYQGTALHTQIQTIAQKFFTDILLAERDGMHSILRWYQYPLKTLNTAGFEKVVTQATDIIHQKMIRYYADNGQNESAESRYKSDQSKVNTMSRVRAYYEHTYKNFADLIVMFIEAQIITQYRTGIADHLLRGLGVSKADGKSVELSFRSVTNIVQRLRDSVH